MFENDILTWVTESGKRIPLLITAVSDKMWQGIDKSDDLPGTRYYGSLKFVTLNFDYQFETPQVRRLSMDDTLNLMSHEVYAFLTKGK